MSKVTSAPTAKSRRIVPLEAWRGLAAIVVVFHHFCFGFAPAFHGGLEAHRTPESWTGHFTYVLVNGEAAVGFFFVLSGYVLTLKFFATEQTRSVAEGFIKRIPRLAGPVLVTTVASWALFRFGGYAYAEAGAITGSEWLATFASAVLPQPFEPSLARAIAQGGFLTFLSGENFYNTNLWTMRVEFLGSMLVFTVAPVWVFVFRHRMIPAAFGLTLVCVMYLDPIMIPFVVGMGLAYVSVHRGNFCCGPWFAVALTVVGLYLLGYKVPEEHYGWLQHVTERLNNPLYKDALPLVVHTTGALAIIYATLSSRLYFKIFDNRLGIWLGKLSFPVYLVHTLILCSAGSHAFLWARANGYAEHANLLTLATTVALTLIVSVGLAYFDDWWVRRVNRVTRRITDRYLEDREPAAPGPGAASART